MAKEKGVLFVLNFNRLGRYVCSSSLFALYLFLLVTNCYAKNCKKGKPCGNSCIASWKTCRKGLGSSSVFSAPRSVPSSSSRSGSSSISCSLLDVIDGDTLHVSVSRNEKKIRLYGVDTPEITQDFGQYSRQFLSRIISGKSLSLDIYGRDKYGRYIAVVFAGGLNVNEVLVSNGAAWVYNAYCKEDFCMDWIMLEAKARRKR